ncbi:MAG: acyl-CoA thioesterase [Pirellulales bacterium]|nr:acyl-CoA thioesterase [Pirellulales bacterium]
MPQPFSTQRRVEFRDTDTAGIAHFTAFFYYMEAAEHECLRSLGLSVLMQDADGHLTWPRVAAACQYFSPARFEDLLSIEVSVLRLGTKSVTWNFLFHAGPRRIAQGTLTSVCCRLEEHGPRSIEIPDWFRQRLQPLLLPPCDAAQNQA